MQFPFVIVREHDDDTRPDEGYEEIPVTVTGIYYPASRGRSEYRGGPPLEPDEAEWFEIEAIRDGAGNDVATDAQDDEMIQDEALKLVNEGRDDE